MPIMRGGPLKNDEFQFKHVEFRWGSSDCRGAEHSIDNVWLEKAELFINNVSITHLNIRV